MIGAHKKERPRFSAKNHVASVHDGPDRALRSPFPRASEKAVPMTKAVPMKLPDDFQWVEATPDDDWSGARLDLDGHPVLEVAACRGGWLVVVLMDDPRQPQANVAVRSIPAGMRWSAR